MTHVDEVIALREVVKRQAERIRELEARITPPPFQQSREVPRAHEIGFLGDKPAFERR